MRVRVVDKDGYSWVVKGRSLEEVERKIIKLLMKRRREVEARGDVRCRIILRRRGFVLGWMSCWQGKRGWDQAVAVFVQF